MELLCRVEVLIKVLFLVSVPMVPDIVYFVVLIKPTMAHHQILVWHYLTAGCWVVLITVVLTVKGQFIL